MTALLKLCKQLECCTDMRECYIPKKWNYISAACTCDPCRPDEIIVRPARFFRECIAHILAMPTCERNRNTTQCILYSMLPRLFSAWPHYGNGEICTGTFLKSLCLLPLLRALGINTVYLLPFYETGRHYQKGGLASPYCIRDITKIDPALHDGLLGEETPVETEFQAFVEACHHLGMNVIADFVFRTVARDSVLVEEHPDWFYWIDAASACDFAPPTVPEAGHAVITPEYAALLYRSPHIAEYISRFVSPPEKEEWERLRSSAQAQGKSLIEYAEEKLHKIVMPGFADTLNDPQPPWTDVTFPKFYFDLTPPAKAAAKEGTAPFIAQDGIKCSVFPCGQPNSELWEYVRKVIPCYIQQYGIDGARIDMAHALPAQLNQEMIRKIRDCDANFLLWSEEFSAANGDKAEQEGYSFITGDFWDLWDQTTHPAFNRRLTENLASALPAAAALEMADTPRSAYLLPKDAWECMLYLTAVLPHTVFVVNNGEELGDIQPMNLGLKNTPEGPFVLPPAHPLYGKLAFFDKSYLNWCGEEFAFSSIQAAIRLRLHFQHLLSDPASSWRVPCGTAGLTVIYVENKTAALLAIVNRDACAHAVVWEELLEHTHWHAEDLRLVLQKRAQGEWIESNGIIIMEMAVESEWNPK